MSHQALIRVLAAASVLNFSVSSMAQESAPGASGGEVVLEEIMVTAQKRTESAQNVPISMTVLTNEALITAGVLNPADLQKVAPTLRYATSIGTLAARFSVRGIGSFSNSAIEPSVAFFQDGIYIPRPAAIANSLLDVEAVEVLSGPQGTLFGRNASAGAVFFRSGSPTGDFSGKARVDIDDGNRSRFEGVLNAPVNDAVSFRFAGLADNFDGYWKNDLNGKNFGGIDTYQGRLSMQVKPDERLTWMLRGEYQQNKGDGTQNTKLLPASVTPATLARITSAQNGIVPNLNLYDGHNNSYTAHNIVDDSIWGVSSNLAYSFGSDYTIKLLNGYYDWDSRQGDGDTAALSVYVLGRNLNYTSKSNSHELQFISPKDQLLDGRLDYVAGLYFYHEDFGLRQASLNGPDFCRVIVPTIPPVAGALPGATTADKIAACQAIPPDTETSVGDFDQATRSVAAYSQATYKLLPTVDFTGGVRWTDEKKTGSYIGTFTPTGIFLATNENTSLKLTDSRVTWRANLSWRPHDNLMLFTTASTGFKSGGFNNGINPVKLNGIPGDPLSRLFKAETTRNYEAGIKSQWLDNRLQVNATAYWMEVSNYQERSIVGTVSSIRNVGSIRNKGIEFSSEAVVTQFLKLNASVAYLDAEITNYPNGPVPNYLPGAGGRFQDLKGITPTYSPKWSGVVGGEVHGDVGSTNMGWAFNLSTSFVSRQSQGTLIDNNPYTVQGGYALVDARLSLIGDNDAWSVSVFGKNLADRGYCAATVLQVIDGQIGARYNTATGAPAVAPATNDATAIRCLVGAPRVLGVSASMKF
jgi:iron complex outermembrane recepter protein